jgi:hypothetical protein
MPSALHVLSRRSGTINTSELYRSYANSRYKLDRSVVRKLARLFDDDQR